jgi:hypothetical protein
MTFCNKLVFYGEGLSPCPNQKLEDHPLSFVHSCSFSIFAATLHPQPEDAPCRGDKGHHLTWLVIFTKDINSTAILQFLYFLNNTT